MKIEKVTPKQLQILQLLYRYRFLNRIQIQTFLNHKNHARISIWLKDLYDRKIINRIYNQTLLEIHNPAIYYLSKKSIPILKQKNEYHPQLLPRIYRENQRSKEFINKMIFIGDLHFHFQKAASKNSDICQLYTSTDLYDIEFMPEKLPHAYIKFTDKIHTKRYFIELFTQTMPMYAIRSRIKEYIEYYEDGYWQDNYNIPFPKILLITPLPRVIKSIKRFINNTLEEECIDQDLQFFLANQTNIQKHGITYKTWMPVTS